MLATTTRKVWRVRGLVLLSAAAVVAMVPTKEALAKARPRAAALRFSGRLQMLSGVAFTLPEDAAGQRHFAAYVPVDLEIAARLSGPLSLALGGVGYLAPFSAAACPGAPAEPDVYDVPASRANALGAFAGLRLDFNNSRDGAWWSPWVALRGGVLGQSGVADGSLAGPEPGSLCVERYLLGLYLSPRLGMDLWLGRAAVTFAVGYDHLPRAAAISAQVGLTLRLF